MSAFEKKQTRAGRKERKKATNQLREREAYQRLKKGGIMPRRPKTRRHAQKGANKQNEKPPVGRRKMAHLKRMGPLLSQDHLTTLGKQTVFCVGPPPPKLGKKRGQMGCATAGPGGELKGGDVGRGRERVTVMGPKAPSSSSGGGRKTQEIITKNATRYKEGNRRPIGGGKMGNYRRKGHHFAPRFFLEGRLIV